MASLYIAFNYVRRHLPKFLLICFCCAILISSAVLIPINSSIFSADFYRQTAQKVITADCSSIPATISTMLLLPSSIAV